MLTTHVASLFNSDQFPIIYIIYDIIFIKNECKLTKKTSNTTIFPLHNTLYIKLQCFFFCYYRTTQLHIKSSLHICVDVTHNQVCVSLDTHHSQHLERHKSKAVCQKSSLILGQCGRTHTQRAQEKSE